PGNKGARLAASAALIVTPFTVVGAPAEQLHLVGQFGLPAALQLPESRVPMKVVHTFEIQ
ncbi:hypothetical protein, partial [Xanthomonas euvesicatoria]|uniref:hypothetical protein n=1 Tax=Xanthomonas euvesicatoria TaxID=456327 RepID=UPI0019CFAE85